MHTSLSSSVRRDVHTLNRKVLGLGMALILVMSALLALQPAPAGSAGMARLLKDIKPELGSNPSGMMVHGAAIFFTADDGVNGRELWKTDGTPSGTTMVADLNPGPASGFDFASGPLISFKDDLFFTADDGVHGRELWKTDGTAAGTSLVRDIVSGAETSRVHSLTVVSDTLFFVAEESVHGSELWKTDGTEAGTVFVKDTTPNDVGHEHRPELLTDINGTLYFMNDVGINNTHVQLWKSDGTEAGTVVVKSFAAIGSNPYIAQFTVMGGLIFFVASNIEGGELWQTDGTTAGTQPVKDFAVDSTSGLRSLMVFKNQLYFFADSWGAQGALWKSDGTDAGTVMVKNISDGSGNSYAGYMTIFNDQLMFVAEASQIGRQVWVSDGTESGTTVLKSITPPNEHIAWFSLMEAAGSLYLGPTDGVHGREPWVSDGTAGGTKMLQDIAPGAAGSDPDNFIGLNGRVVFTADDGVHGRELWLLPLTTFTVHLPHIQR